MDRSIECSDGNSLVACVSGVADPNLMFSWKQEKYTGVIEIESWGSFVFSIKSFPKTFSPSFYESRTSVKVWSNYMDAQFLALSQIRNHH